MFKVTLFVLLSTAILNGATASAEQMEFYPMTTVVTQLIEEEDVVVCTDFNGGEWSFYGVEDWSVGDYASCIVCDNGTLEISDDIICEVRYDGCLLSGNFGNFSNQDLTKIVM